MICDVLLADPDRLGDEALSDRLEGIALRRQAGIAHGVERRFTAALHPLDRPEEVPGRRARGPRIVGRSPSKAARKAVGGGGVDRTRAQGDPHRRGDADGRGAADREILDRRDDLAVVGAGDIPLRERQGPLVDHDDGVVLPENGADCLFHH